MTDAHAGTLRLAAGGLEVRLWNDHTYSREPTDNVHTYPREIVIADEHRQAVGMSVHQGEQVLTSAVLLFSLGCPGPCEIPPLIREDALYLPLGPQVAALSLPSLEPRWVRTVDDACVFELVEIEGEDALLVHGELAITRLAMDGAIQWQRGGADIFTGGCWIERGTVVAVDWNGTEHRWRLSDGEPLGVTPGAHPPAQAV
jgi:hypothetical protein